MQKLFLCFTVRTTIVTLAGQIEGQNSESTMPCEQQQVSYRPLDPVFGEKIALATINESSRRSGAKERSPQGTRYLLRNEADFSRPGPWTTTVLIGGVGMNRRLLKLTFIDHASGGVHVQWMNDKLVLVQVWWGRIASTDLILDVSSKTFLYKETADYGDMIQPCD